MRRREKYAGCTKIGFIFLHLYTMHKIQLQLPFSRQFRKYSGNFRFSLPSRRGETGRKSFALSDFIISTAVEGCSYAEGAQRGSDATPLRVPARGGVQFSNKLHHRPREQLSRAATRKPQQWHQNVRAGEVDAVSLYKSQLSLSRMVENTKSLVKWIRLTADWRSSVRLNEANVQFRFASVSDCRNSLSNLVKINRRGHSNYTTKAYALSRPKTHRAHILCSTTTLYALPRD